MTVKWNNSVRRYPGNLKKQSIISKFNEHLETLHSVNSPKIKKKPTKKHGGEKTKL